MPNIDQFQARSGRLIKEDGTVVNEANGINADGSQNVSLVSSNVAQPVDIQARLSQTIQTHNAVSVALSGNSQSAWLDCDGFDKIAFSLINDASTNSSMDVYWSNDGTNIHATERVIATGAGTNRQPVETGTKARYYKVRINNEDAALAHTMSAWAYLKA